MRKLVVLFVIILMMASLGFGKGIVNFKRIGYMKVNKLRYFTFNISTKIKFNREKIPNNIKNAIKKHGSKQMNTIGKITASFYYLKGAPDVTLLTPMKANNLAHDKKPIISVWVMPNGQVNVFENPE